MRPALTLIVYDVVSNKRRTKVHRLCEQFGTAVQKSAFEARLTREERARLLSKATELLDAGEDSLHMYVIGRQQEKLISVIGRSRPRIAEEQWFVV